MAMPDVRQQISSVRRTLGRRTLEAGEARVSTISQVYETDIDDLWTVVTSAERIERWFMPITGELKEGGHYQLEGNAGGTITSCDKPHGFTATWEFGGDVSWITVRLAETDGGTRFELEHVAHVKDEWWDQFGPGATGIGWDSGLLGLASYVLDRNFTRLSMEEVMAWVAEGDGKLFMRLSADAWAEVSIADGEDPAVAAARADRGYAAYTGT
ncbi:SRPBCC family protein [Paractinoplanes toevensis]|uniref:Activator of HSP90 ATPase n=1 Tax=Paractinoplanes toevensis TaxID=571911 RepID=A0A919W6X2_9ACTN|nr:SRPBCC family protein [Actinoplanes toevensis]GIM93768.1 activator of HSP90 ATPase [Actinoplanes toevensis]